MPVPGIPVPVISCGGKVTNRICLGSRIHLPGRFPGSKGSERHPHIAGLINTGLKLHHIFFVHYNGSLINNPSANLESRVSSMASYNGLVPVQENEPATQVRLKNYLVTVFPVFPDLIIGSGYDVSAFTPFTRMVVISLQPGTRRANVNVAGLSGCIVISILSETG